MSQASALSAQAPSLQSHFIPNKMFGAASQPQPGLRQRALISKQQTGQLRNAFRSFVVDGTNCREDSQKGAALKSDHAFAEDSVVID